MFCPNCGANNSTEQKFCRSCGLNLERTAESLLMQVPSAESAKLLKRERNLERFGNIAFGGFGVVLLSGIGAIIYYTFTKMILSGQSVIAGIFIIAFLIFAALTLIYVAFREDLNERKQKLNPTLKDELSEAKTAGRLLEDKPFEPVPSVTENTTDLLYTESKTRKFE